LGATVHGRGFTPDTSLKGLINIKSDIADVPNFYTVATFGETLIFLFRAVNCNGPIVGGATFVNPFKNHDIDWHGELKWEHLVPIHSKAIGTELLKSNATPDESWKHAPITVEVVMGAFSRVVVAKVDGHQGVLEIDSDINANPPFPFILKGTLWYKPEMFNLEINAWQLTVKKAGGYYLTFTPQISFEPNVLGYAHLDTFPSIVPAPGDWFGNVMWALDGQPIQPPESNQRITLSFPQGVADPVATATVGTHVTTLPGLDTFFSRVLHTGNGNIDVHGWVHIDRPNLFGEGFWVMQANRAFVPPGGTFFAVLTFYSNFLIHDTRQVVGQATFNGIPENPTSKDPPSEWNGDFLWKTADLALTTIDPPKNLPLTAELRLVLPNVAISPRKITADFNGWRAVLPDNFAIFFIYTPYQSAINFLSPKIVAGTLLYEPSLTGVMNRWTVETARGGTQAVMTLYSALLGPMLPLGFAIFNGRFPAGSWEGILEWMRPVEDEA